MTRSYQKAKFFVYRRKRLSINWKLNDHIGKNTHKLQLWAWVSNIVYDRIFNIRIVTVGMTSFRTYPIMMRYLRERLSLPPYAKLRDLRLTGPQNWKKVRLIHLTEWRPVSWRKIRVQFASRTISITRCLLNVSAGKLTRNCHFDMYLMLAYLVCIFQNCFLSGIRYALRNICMQPIPSHRLFAVFALTAIRHRHQTVLCWLRDPFQRIKWWELGIYSFGSEVYSTLMR